MIPIPIPTEPPDRPRQFPGADKPRYLHDPNRVQLERLQSMSIPLIDLSNPDIVELAEQVKDACSVRTFVSLMSVMGIHVPQKPRHSKFLCRQGI